MNCHEFWNRTSAPLSPPDEAGAAHLCECQACAAAFHGQRAVVDGLRQVAAGWKDLEAPPRVEARLLAAFRGQAGLGARGSSRWWLPVATWAGAAAAMAGLALFLVHDREPRPPQRTRVEAVQLADAAALLDPAYEGFADDSGFIPLPNAESTAGEDLNMVRVEVPRSAMIALGYTVSAERAAELVEAEVILGPDGLARAVRFADE